MQTIEIDVEPSNEPWLPLLAKAGKNGTTESAMAYDAFQTYYTMEKRSLKKVAQKHGKSVKLIVRRSREFHWVERAGRWDEHQGGFGNPENWNLVTKKHETDDKQSEQPWLPLAAQQGKDGATETALNYARFLMYCLMPPSERSLREVARQSCKSEKLIQRWSAKFRWIERAAAWDKRQARIFAAEYEERRREQAVAEARKVNNANERVYQTLEKLQDKAEQMLAFPLIEKVLETDAEGRPTVILKPAGWSFNTTIAMLVVAERIQRHVFKSVDEQYGRNHLLAHTEDDD